MVFSVDLCGGVLPVYSWLHKSVEVSQDSGWQALIVIAGIDAPLPLSKNVWYSTA